MLIYHSLFPIYSRILHLCNIQWAKFIWARIFIHPFVSLQNTFVTSIRSPCKSLPPTKCYSLIEIFPSRHSKTDKSTCCALNKFLPPHDRAHDNDDYEAQGGHFEKYTIPPPPPPFSESSTAGKIAYRSIPPPSSLVKVTPTLPGN